MTRVLLFDADPNHAEGVALSLRAAACEVAVCCDLASTLRTLRSAVFDVLILAICTAQEWERNIDLVQELVGHKPSSPEVICLSRRYCGPQQRLEMERKGVRLVHER